MKDTHQKNQNKHYPVLVNEVLAYLKPGKGETYLDLTAGYGGHAKTILDRTLKPLNATLVDRDKDAIKHLKAQFGDSGVEIIQKDYLSASRKLLKDGRKYNLILADLGVSSPHLNEASRGFSFQADGPIDMRMDQSQDLQASDIVNHYSEKELANIIRLYGEEPKARQIAHLIVTSRPVNTTQELASIIKTAWPRYSKTHPATRTFQALRIFVNDELKQLEDALPVWIELLEPSGRIAIISFHSLEDRIIKQFFKSLSGDRYDATLELLTKRPIQASQTETVTNPRARSAKLRAAAKIKNRKGVNHYAYTGKKSLPGI
jgi:16S rRNA (cytosine1402-N4)-methyltransferase